MFVEHRLSSRNSITCQIRNLLACVLMCMMSVGFAQETSNEPPVPEAASTEVVPADATAPTSTPDTAADTAMPAAGDAVTSADETAPPADDAAATDAASDNPDAEVDSEYKSLDQDVQSVKKEVLDLNRELFTLEEELLFPANTQVAVFVSMDVGTFFAIDTLKLKMDNKEVANYLYTEREAQALLKGGVQRVYIGNLKVGKHELVAFFTGQGPHQRDYKRGATLNFEKGVGAKYLELKISDKQVKEQPEFVIKEWE